MNRSDIVDFLNEFSKTRHLNPTCVLKCSCGKLEVTDFLMKYLNLLKYQEYIKNEPLLWKDLY
jgi:hypothetical protein